MSDGGIEVELRKIKKLKFWSLSDVLIDKYHFENAEAHKISDFLLPLLRLNPKDRADLGGWSNHSWLDDPSLSEEENEEIGFVDRPCGSCGEDIKGWHKTYVRPDHHNHHHHHHHHR
jgi:serine/threonine-protein kinase SRPK3